MWRYIGGGRNIAGVPAEDMTDERFADIEAKIDAQFGAKGSLSTCQHPESEREKGHACLLYIQEQPAKAAEK